MLNKFIYENKTSIYTNPYLRRNQYNMNSLTNTSFSVDYKTLYNEEKKLKEAALIKVDKINTTAFLLINKLQQENVRLKDENKILIEERKYQFEKNLTLVEENESLIIRNQILVTEKNHLEKIYQELSDMMMFLSNFFNHGFEVARNIFYDNYYHQNYIVPENLDISLENDNYLVTENEVEVEKESENEMTDIESVISIGTNSLTTEEDYDNYLSDKNC